MLSEATALEVLNTLRVEFSLPVRPADARVWQQRLLLAGMMEQNATTLTDGFCKKWGERPQRKPALNDLTAFCRHMQGFATGRVVRCASGARSHWERFDAEHGIPTDDRDGGPKLDPADPRVGECIGRMKAKARRLAASVRDPGSFLSRRDARDAEPAIVRDDPGQRRKLEQQALVLAEGMDVLEDVIPF